MPFFLLDLSFLLPNFQFFVISKFPILRPNFQYFVISKFPILRPDFQFFVISKFPILRISKFPILRPYFQIFVIFLPSRGRWSPNETVYRSNTRTPRNSEKASRSAPTKCRSSSPPTCPSRSSTTICILSGGKRN